MSALQLKRFLVGRAAGHRLLRLRQLWDLWKTVSRDPERGSNASQAACTGLLLPRLCASDETFVDVGAHIGSVVSEVRGFDPGIRIIAVEAVPEKAAYLADRFADVEVHACAVGDEDGIVRFFVDLDRPGYSSLDHGEESTSRVQEIEVEMRRLDDLLSEVPSIGMIKIDVEGAELRALRGGAAILERCRPAVCFESALATEETLTLFDFLTSLGYEIFVPDRVAHDAPALGRDGYLEAHHYPRRTTDYFAIHESKRIEYRDRARRALGVSS